MELVRMLSGNSRLKERAREAEQVNEVFEENLDNVEGVLKSDESTNVYALLHMIYETSFPEYQIFMKTPTRARLKSKKELLVRLLSGLDALGVPTMAEMLMFVRKHGSEGISESLVTLLELLSPFLKGKQAPEFTTDDVIDAMWHPTSRTGSPLWNVIASATSSPRASAASPGDSPLMLFLLRSHELGAKSVLDKTATSASPHHPALSLATGGGALDEEVLSSIQTHDSSRKGSRRVSPPLPYNEVALWREYIDGFTVDLVSSNKNPAQASADDAGCKSPYEPLILCELEAEVHSSGVDCAGQAHESEAGAQCERDEDFEEHARRAHSLDINHKEDGENATYLLDITHGEEPGHSYSLDDHEEGAIHAHVLDNHHEQHERENASDEINPEGSLQEGIGFQWSLAPLLLPSTSHLSEEADDLPANIHEGDSPSLQGGAQQGDIEGEKGPLLKGQYEVPRGSHITSPSSLQNDKVLNDMVGSISDEKEDIEVHASCQDLQPTLIEAVDSNQISPMHAANMTNDVPLSLAHARPDDNIAKVLPIDEERGHLLSCMSADVLTTSSHADNKSSIPPDIDCVTSSSPSDRECVAEVDVSELSDDLHQYNHIEIEGNTKGIHNCDILGIDRNSMKISPELKSDDDNKGNVHMHVDDVSAPCDMDDQGYCAANVGLEEQLIKRSDDQFEQLLSEINDPAEELAGTAIHASGELPLLNAQSNIEGGKMGTHDNVKEGITHEEADSARGWDDEKMRTDDEKMKSGDGKVQSDDNADKELVPHTGKCITGSPRQYIPSMIVEVLQQRETSKPFWETSEVVDVSRSPPLDDYDDRSQRSAVQSTDFRLAAKPNSLHHDGDRIQRSATQSPDSGRQCAVNSIRSHSLPDEDDSIQLSVMQFPDSGRRQCAVNSIRSHSLQDEDDRIQHSAVQFTDSAGRQCAMNVDSLHDDDHIQRSATQSRGSRSSSAVVAADDETYRLIHAGELASLEDHDLCSPSSLSKKVDIPAANLHGKPHVGPQKQTEPATVHDLTIGRWDVDTKEPRSKRRTSGAGRLAGGCLSCCRKPPTNP